jgi:hypothetical protein
VQIGPFHRDHIVAPKKGAKTLACVALKTGKTLWEADLPIRAHLAVPRPPRTDSLDPGTVGCVQDMHQICAFDLANGELLWQRTNSNRQRLVSGADFVFILGRQTQNSTVLTGVEVLTGHYLWERAFPKRQGRNLGVPVSAPGDHEFTVLVGDESGGHRVVRIDKRTGAGAADWEIKPPAVPISLLTLDHKLVLVTDGRELWARFRATGEEAWRRELTSGSLVRWVGADLLVVGTLAGEEDSQEWKGLILGRDGSTFDTPEGPAHIAWTGPKPPNVVADRLLRPVPDAKDGKNMDWLARKNRTHLLDLVALPEVREIKRDGAGETFTGMMTVSGKPLLLRAAHPHKELLALDPVDGSLQPVVDLPGQTPDGRGERFIGIVPWGDFLVARTNESYYFFEPSSRTETPAPPATEGESSET